MKKNKICIITCNDLSNYGNRLQNIALSKYLEKSFDCKVETLWPHFPYSFKHYVGYFYRSLLFSIKNAFSLEKKKRSLFRKFNRKELKLCRLWLAPFRKNKLNNAFDYFVLGSDQVWNQTFGVNNECKFLSFVDDSRKKNTYAASAGNDAIKNDCPEIFKQLSDFAHISVREEETKTFLTNCIESKIEVNIDPVFLLNQDEWRKIYKGQISKKALNMMKEPFVFVYWLGKLPDDIKNKIDAFAKKNNLKIIWTVTNQAYREYQFVDCSPYDFIALLDKAKFAFVKSFHGTAMSLILNKPFLSFDIVHQNNSNIWDPRLIGLSKKLGFSNKVFDWNNIVFESFDWASINDAISLEATKSYNYFADILKLLDEETKQH